MEFKRVKNKESKLKNFISLIIIVGIILAQIPILINAYIYEYSNRYVLTVEEAKNYNVDCVLVLGAGVRDGAPTHILQERIFKSVEVFNTGCTDRILMSGDHGKTDYNEVGTMKNFAIDSGINSEDIFMDHAGFSTYESIYRAKEIFGAEKIIIVSAPKISFAL